MRLIMLLLLSKSRSVVFNWPSVLLAFVVTILHEMHTSAHCTISPFLEKDGCFLRVTFTVSSLFCDSVLTMGSF